MQYWLDGYNLLFFLSEEEKNFQKKRENLIKFVQDNFSHLKILLFFDATHQEDDFFHATDHKNLTIIFTPSKLTADQFIVEKLSHEKYKKNITVISSDKGLQRHALDLNAKIMTLETFLTTLKRKNKTPKEKKPSIETDHEFERLLKIFEKRSKDDF